MGIYLFLVIALNTLLSALSIPLQNYMESSAIISTSQKPFGIYLYFCIVYILFISIVLLTHIGYLKIIFKLIDKQKARIKDMVAHYRLFFKYLFANLISLLMFFCIFFLSAAIMGLFKWFRSGHFQFVNHRLGNSTPDTIVAICIAVFALTSFFYLLTKFGFTPFLIVDKEFGPIQALKESARISNGAKKEIVLFFLLFIVIISVPVSALKFGIFNLFVEPNIIDIIKGTASEAVYIIDLLVNILIELPGILAMILFITAYMVVYRMLDQQTNPEEYAVDGVPEDDIVPEALEEAVPEETV